MMRKSILIALLTIAIIPAISQTVIKGKALNAIGERVRVIGFKDLFLFQREPLAQAIVDENGYYELAFETNDTRFCLLTIDYQQDEFYAVPNKTFYFDLNFDQNSPLVAFADAPDFNMKMKNLDKKGVNAMINRANSVFNQFMIDFHKDYMVKKRFLIDSLRQRMGNELINAENKYVRDYVKYKMATLVMVSKSMNNGEIVTEYFLKKPILYNNIEYMDFMKSFFDLSFSGNLSKKNWKDILRAVNIEGTYDALYSIMQDDPYFKQDYRILELAMLEGLRELYYMEGINSDNVIKIIEEASHNMKVTEHKRMANNLITYLTRLEIDTQAPYFSFPDFAGNKVTLDDFEGKKFFIDFWTYKCKPCMDELDSIANYLEHNKTDIEFVSVNIDKNFDKAKAIIENRGYDWNMLYYNDNIETLEEWDIRSILVNYLIDEKGNIIRKPGRRSEEPLSKVIDYYTRGKGKQ